MTLGAEPKKVAILGAVVVVGIVVYFMNSTGDSTPAAPPRIAVTNPANALPAVTTSSSPRTKARVANGEIRYRVLGTRPEDRIDPASIDPELKLDLLAKVQAVPPLEGGRNLFQFGTAPAPDKPLPPVPTSPKIAISQPPPKPTVNVLNSVLTGPPPAPPITFKYYGFRSRSDGRKLAFLMDGDDIILATENQTVKQRYRIVRIATTSIDIEDTQFKSTQTLKLQEPPPS
jgi:hypothetical protein